MAKRSKIFRTSKKGGKSTTTFKKHEEPKTKPTGGGTQAKTQAISLTEPRGHNLTGETGFAKKRPVF